MLHELSSAGERSLIAHDARGVYRFNGRLRNAADVSSLLDRLASQREWSEAVARDRVHVLELFESVFRHATFTGRSGTMYGYEGLGSIYWHMVGKLLLAIQEIALHADDDETRGALVEMYYRVRAGLGFEKSAAEYGAFPTDPYSHTPAHAGAQQPGMTGQVKEEILTRFGELGVVVEVGVVAFKPVLLREREFFDTGTKFTYFDTSGRRGSVDVPARGLAFTFCQVPVVYELVEGDAWIRTTSADGETREHAGNGLDADTSKALFARDGSVSLIHVGVPGRAIFGP